MATLPVWDLFCTPTIDPVGAHARDTGRLLSGKSTGLKLIIEGEDHPESDEITPERCFSRRDGYILG